MSRSMQRQIQRHVERRMTYLKNDIHEIEAAIMEEVDANLIQPILRLIAAYDSKDEDTLLAQIVRLRRVLKSRLTPDEEAGTPEA